MKRLVMLLGAFLLFSGFTLSWDPVTKYVDNTVIGAEAQGVFYNVEMDNALASGNFSGSVWVIPAVAKKSTHTFRARTVLGTGEVSAWTSPFSWTSPGANPNPPSNLQVVP